VFALHAAHCALLLLLRGAVPWQVGREAARASFADATRRMGALRESRAKLLADAQDAGAASSDLGGGNGGGNGGGGNGGGGTGGGPHPLLRKSLEEVTPPLS
jgi:hypothetical protein